MPVYLISGGFRSIISPLALRLNVPLENVYANKMKFFFNGGFAGFDENEPTSDNGGKGRVISELKNKYCYSNVVMIGDGMTDLEACPPADAFIGQVFRLVDGITFFYIHRKVLHLKHFSSFCTGYGGNIVREEVKNKAEWYVTDFQELINALK